MSSDPLISSPDSPPPPWQDPATLARLPRRTLFLGLLLLPAIALSFYLTHLRTTPPPSATTAREAIPTMIPQGNRVWTALDSTLSERELQVLETRDYVFRTYLDNAGPPVDLCIIFSQDNRKGTHPPDVCLEGNGSRIVARYERNLTMPGGQSLAIREIVSRFNNQLQYFSYFYKVGDSFTPSYYSQQGKIIWLGLTNRSAASALVRYSTTMDGGSDGDLQKARARADDLLTATFPYIQNRLHAP